MTVQDYKNKGFLVSAMITESYLQKCEEEIITAYIKPFGELSEEAKVIAEKATMNLTYLLICQRNTIATRGGGKEKTTLNSYAPNAESKINELSKTCDLWLRELGVKCGKFAEVNDICKIYFITNFFYN